MASTGLTAPEEQLAQRFGRMCADSAKVVDIADRTYELARDPETGDLIRPNGMSDAQWNLHCDAMKSTRNMPGYLVAHYTRIETAHKLAGLKGTQLPKIAEYVVGVITKVEYPVIDVTPTDEGK